MKLLFVATCSFLLALGGVNGASLLGISDGNNLGFGFSELYLLSQADGTSVKVRDLNNTYNLPNLSDNLGEALGYNTVTNKLYRYTGGTASADTKQCNVIEIVNIGVYPAVIDVAEECTGYPIVTGSLESVVGATTALVNMADATNLLSTEDEAVYTHKLSDGTLTKIKEFEFDLRGIGYLDGEYYGVGVSARSGVPVLINLDIDDNVSLPDCGAGGACPVSRPDEIQITSTSPDFIPTRVDGLAVDPCTGTFWCILFGRRSDQSPSLQIAKLALNGMATLIGKAPPGLEGLAFGDENCPHAAGSEGDPHFKTWTHEQFDFHGACDLVLLNNPKFDNDAGMDIHIRTKIRFSWSYIETAILRIGQDTLEIMGGDLRRYWINGVFGSGGSDFPTKIGGYTVDYVKKGSGPSKQRIYTVDLGKGEKIILKTYKDFVSVDLKAIDDETFADSVGLMGSYTTGHKIARDGETIMNDPVAFGQEWQVLATEPKLFHSLEGPQQPLQQCEMPAKRRLNKGVRRLGQPEVEDTPAVTISQSAAEAACRRVTGEDHDLCVFDVMATSDIDMAGAY
jgi:hypothetical protein